MARPLFVSRCRIGDRAQASVAVLGVTLLAVGLGCGGRAVSLDAGGSEPGGFGPNGAPEVSPTRPEVPESVAPFAPRPVQSPRPNEPAAMAPSNVPMGQPAAPTKPIPCPDSSAATVIVAFAQSEIDVLAGCEALYGLRVGNPLDLRPLARLRRVGAGGLDMSGSRSLEGLEVLEATSLLRLFNTSVQSLGPLRALRRVESLELTYSSLSDLSGTNISGIRSLNVTSNASLESLEGLSFEAEMTSFVVGDNATLHELPSVAGVEAINDIVISGNPLLVQVPAFERLTQLSNFAMSSNFNLRVAPSFPLLTDITGELYIWNNGLLEAVTGFAALERAGSIWIQGNPSLLEVDLGQLRQATTSLAIFENPQLDGVALAAELADVESAMHRVATNQAVSAQDQNPCPWTSDDLCDEVLLFCARNTDPVCRTGYY